MLSCNFIELVHWNNTPRVDKSLHIILILNQPALSVQV